MLILARFTEGKRSVIFPCCPDRYIQVRSRGRVPGVLEAPFWVSKMNFISNGKTNRKPPLEIPQDQTFVFEEEQKEINLKIRRMLYRRLQYFKGA